MPTYIINYTYKKFGKATIKANSESEAIKDLEKMTNMSTEDMEYLDIKKQ